MNLPPLTEQMDLIHKGAVEIIAEEDLEKKITRSLAGKKPLLVKAGFRPDRARSCHLGHTVLIRKMKHFQDLGHKVVFLIGDFTGLIGDPSGRNKDASAAFPGADRTKRLDVPRTDLYAPRPGNDGD